MKYRKLGHTGLDVSVLALGGSSLGGAFGAIDEAEGIRAVHAAIDGGINLIDTAPYYGQTRAEVVLGRALREIPRERYVLATKVARYGAEQRDFDFSAERVTRSVDESLGRLGLETIDFIQVHDIEFGSIDQIVEETIPALRRIQAAGKVRYVGISGLPVKLFAEVMERVEVEQVQSYCHYCLHDTQLAEILPYLKGKGVAVFNSAPLAMRLLSDEGPPEWHPAPAELKSKCAEAAAYCRRRGASLSNLALQFSTANLEIDTNIVGAADAKRVEENIRVVGDPLDEELLTAVREILRPVRDVTWQSGRVENN
ncbi:aldo/keto reductase [soil metagenome]